MSTTEPLKPCPYTAFDEIRNHGLTLVITRRFGIGWARITCKCGFSSPEVMGVDEEYATAKAIKVHNSLAWPAPVEGVSVWAERLLELLDIPEKDCRCHISPPCNECVDNWGLREAAESLRAALAASPVPARPEVGYEPARFDVGPAGRTMVKKPHGHYIAYTDYADLLRHSPPAGSPPIELQGVAEAIQEAEGNSAWVTCSGCYETEDGRPAWSYPYSTLLKCSLGSGCSDCGGIGARWKYYPSEAELAAMDEPEAGAGACREWDAETIKDAPDGLYWVGEIRAGSDVSWSRWRTPKLKPGCLELLDCIPQHREGGWFRFYGPIPQPPATTGEA